MVVINNVLIVGDDSVFLTELVNKFYKEGWNICILSEHRIHSRLPARAEQYSLSYASPSVQELMESCRPQLVIFTGAYDTRFIWQEENLESDAGAYIVGLNNILKCAGTASVRHFVYLSSEIVFENSSDTSILEDAVPMPKSPHGLYIAQGEMIATAFSNYSDMEITLVRIGDMYCLPRAKEDCVDRYTSLCLSALLSGSVTVNAKRISAPLFVNDAIFALFLILNAPQRKEMVYHIVADALASEEDIGLVIKRNFEKPITIVDRTSGITQRRVLSDARVANEFHFKARMEYQRAIAMIVIFMEEHRKNFGVLDKHGLREGMRKLIAGLGNFFPFLECVIYFVPFYLLNGLYADSKLFSRVDLYLLYVFLFALMRGRNIAILAFCLSVFGFFLRQLQAGNLLQLLISVDTYLWIVQLFVIGIFVGFLRDKLMKAREEEQETEYYLQKRLEEITAINASNTKIKNYYAEQIVNSNDSMSWLFDVVAELDNSEIGDEIFIATKLLTRLMGVQHVSIYTMVKNGYCRLLASSSSRAAEIGKSIEMSRYPTLFTPLMHKNSFFNQEIVSELPAMAISLVGADNNERLFIFVWDLPFEKKTLHYSNVLMAVGTLIHNATERSARYLDALAYKRYIPETQILQKEAFAELGKVYQRANVMGLTQFCLLTINLDKELSLYEWDKRIKRHIRQTDYMGMLGEQKLSILLPNSTQNEGKIVKDRLAAAGIPSVYYELQS